MILRVKKTLVLKQYEYWFFTVLQSMLQKGIILRISMAGCRIRKTDQDIGNCSMLKSMSSTRAWLFITGENLHLSYFSWINSSVT